LAGLICFLPFAQVLARLHEIVFLAGIVSCGRHVPLDRRPMGALRKIKRACKRVQRLPAKAPVDGRVERMDLDRGEPEAILERAKTALSEEEDPRHDRPVRQIDRLGSDGSLRPHGRVHLRDHLDPRGAPDRVVLHRAPPCRQSAISRARCLLFQEGVQILLYVCVSVAVNVVIGVGGVV